MLHHPEPGLSKMTALKISNMCYACVSGHFAIFSNPEHRGPNFSWDWFVQFCERNVDNWMFVHYPGRITAKNKEICFAFAKRTAGDIARHLVSTMK